MIYFTSDPHFGHKNVVRLGNRPFKNIDEMDESLIRNWNTVVHDDDIVYVLGDFVYKSRKHLKEYTKALNGHKHLILGNHDRLPRIEYEQNFESVQYYLRLEANDQIIILFHYPILSWERRHKGSWHLYGHVHQAGQLEQLSNQKAWNVGVEVNNYTPISFEQLSQIMITRNVKKAESQEG